MRNMVLTMAGLGLLAACSDPSVSERRAAREQVQQAMALVTDAETGFVPQGQESTVSVQIDGRTVKDQQADLQAHRQEVLGQAADKLKPMLDKGSVSQQVAVRQLLADIYASNASYQSRHAMTQWAILANRGATLLSYIFSIDRTTARANSFQNDEAPLLAQLQQNQQETEHRINNLQDQVDQLQQQIGQLSQHIRDREAQVNEAVAHAQQLKDQAFVSHGPSRYTLYDEATQAQRRADRASSQAEQAQVKLDVFQSELAILEKQLHLALETGQIIDQEIANAQQRQRRAQNVRQSARTEKDQVIAKMAQHILEIAPVRLVRSDILGRIDRIEGHAQLAVGSGEPGAVNVRQDDQLVVLLQHAHGRR